MELWPRIRFLGGAGTVTGSKFLLTYDEENILVDCGLFQGLKELRLKNWDRFAIDPRTISAVVLTHAHIDHSGYLPRLFREGFRGKIYCTDATERLCRLLLMDAAHLNEEEARYLNAKGLSKHHPALPLFDRDDANRCLGLFSAQDFSRPFSVGRAFRATLSRAGHILGAASALIEVAGRSVLFSGDLGRPDDPIMKPPEAPLPADYLVIESTYGDSRHPADDGGKTLARLIRRCASDRGVVLVPAFAVGRAQSILHLILRLKQAREIPDIPLFLDSPMATAATDLFHEFPSLHRLTAEDCIELDESVNCIRSVEESKALQRSPGPKIIVSASGMLTGGRILHHLRVFGRSPKNAVVLTGYQAAGTRGRALEQGQRVLSIFGEEVTIEAEVARLDHLSAHADSDELIQWLGRTPSKPRRIFVVHGESSAALALQDRIRSEFRWDCVVPSSDQEFPLR